MVTVSTHDISAIAVVNVDQGKSITSAGSLPDYPPEPRQP
jgi:hypothetical protein